MNRHWRFRSGFCVLFFALAPIEAPARDFYVAPGGTNTGDGGEEHPWTLAYALSHPPALQPGDTIWVRGGTYLGPFTSRLMGARDLPVYVRQYPGERASLDGKNANWQAATLRIEGSWVWFSDLEITNSGPRQLNIARSQGVELYAPYSKLINLVVHDTGQGLGAWVQALDAEVYGNIVYNNGWPAQDRGHGHGIYTHNDTGLKTIRDNIFFRPYGFNFHAYGSSAARLNNYLLEGNTFFEGPFLVGGSPPAQDFVVTQNYFYRANASFGYDNDNNRNLKIADNYFANYVYLKWWDKAAVTGNIVYPSGQTSQDVSISVWLRPGGAASDYTIDTNTYYQGPARDGSDFYYRVSGQGGRTLLFSQWQSFGYDRNSTFEKTATKRPSGTQAFLRPNQYDPAKAYLVVYNWDHWDEVALDLSGWVLQPGEQYELRNVQNYFNETATGIYSGEPVPIPMKTWTAALPVGQENAKVTSTFPEFGVFVLTRMGQPPVANLKTMRQRKSVLALRAVQPARAAAQRRP